MPRIFVSCTVPAADCDFCGAHTNNPVTGYEVWRDAEPVGVVLCVGCAELRATDFNAWNLLARRFLEGRRQIPTIATSPQSGV